MIGMGEGGGGRTNPDCLDILGGLVRQDQLFVPVVVIQTSKLSLEYRVDYLPFDPPTLLGNMFSPMGTPPARPLSPRPTPTPAPVLLSIEWEL